MRLAAESSSIKCKRNEDRAASPRLAPVSSITSPRPSLSPLPSTFTVNSHDSNTAVVRSRSGRPHRRVGRCLPLLVLLAVLLSMAQLWGVGPDLRKALLARCPSHEAATAHGGGLWSHICAREAVQVSAATATSSSTTLASNNTNTQPPSRSSTSSTTSRRSSSSGSALLSGHDRANSDAWELQHNGNRAAAVLDVSGETSAGRPLGARYDPAEWPNVFGGQAGPHKRIMKRCTGSMFAPPLAPGSRPGQGLVGVWRAQGHGQGQGDSKGLGGGGRTANPPLALDLCDVRGRSLELRMSPVVHVHQRQRQEEQHGHQGQQGVWGAGGVGGKHGRQLAGEGRERQRMGGVGRGALGTDGKEGVRAAGRGLGEQVLGVLWGSGRSGSDGQGTVSDGAAQAAAAGVAAGAKAAVVRTGIGSSSGGAGGGGGGGGGSLLGSLAVDLATSRALVAGGGQMRMAWADASTLLADGVAAELVGGRACPYGSRASSTSSSSTSSAAGSGSEGTPTQLEESGGGDGGGGGGGSVGSFPTAVFVRCLSVPPSATPLGGVGGGGWAAAAAGVWRWATGGDAGGAQAAGEEERDAAVAVAVATAPTVVVATAAGGRAVVLVVLPGEDVAAAARSAAAALSDPPAFERRLQAAVQSAYGVLQAVPATLRLPPDTPAYDKRLARKLYDIMLLNTSPSPLPLLPADPGGTATAAAAAAAVAAGAQGGTSKGSVAGGGGNSSSTPAASSPSVWAWSTPDRTPHAWQWLWDSCFHALGMNPLNHTLAWEQLKGLLRCQQPDGFLPHLCDSSSSSSSNIDSDANTTSSRTGDAGRGAAQAPAGGGQEGATGARRRGPTAPASRLTQPPLVAWAVWDNYLFARDKGRLEWALPRIAGLLEWLCANRSPDGGVTFFYVHAFESGMDNSPRFDRHVAVPGATWLGAWLGGGGGARPHALSVDLCALVAREMALAGRIAEELGKEEEAARWRSRGRAVARALVERAWGGDAFGLYGDIPSGSRGPVPLATVAGLLPLLAGRLPQHHLAGLVAHLQDPLSFATPAPIPSVAVTPRPPLDGTTLAARAVAATAAAIAAAAARSNDLRHRQQQHPSSATLADASLFTTATRTPTATATTAATASAAPSPASLDMWRGPSWVNTNYLVAVGLREQRHPACDTLAEWVEDRTIAEVRRWYGGDPPAVAPPAGAAPATATGTVFEFYDSAGAVAPTRLTRKRTRGIGGVRDYHWTAALTLRMMAERAARQGAAARGRGSRSGSGKGWAKGGVKGREGGEELPEWVPGRGPWEGGDGGWDGLLEGAAD